MNFSVSRPDDQFGLRLAAMVTAAPRGDFGRSRVLQHCLPYLQRHHQRLVWLCNRSEGMQVRVLCRDSERSGLSLATRHCADLQQEFRRLSIMIVVCKVNQNGRRPTLDLSNQCSVAAGLSFEVIVFHRPTSSVRSPLNLLTLRIIELTKQRSQIYSPDFAS